MTFVKSIESMISYKVEEFNEKFKLSVSFENPEFIRIVNFNGLWFYVNKSGNISKSKKQPTQISQSLQLRSLEPKICGYFQVMFNRQLYLVHRIIFKAFNPDINIDDLVINHIDNIHTHNQLDNLEAITQKDNVQQYHKTQKHQANQISYDNVKEWIILNFTDLHNLPNYKKLLWSYNNNIKYIGYHNEVLCLFYTVADDLKNQSNHP